MRELLHEKLYANSTNVISYYDGSIRKKKTYRELAEDVQELLERFDYLRSKGKVETIGILGHVSYDWIVADLACIKGGFKSVAIPETFSCDKVLEVIREVKVDLLLLDYRLADGFSGINNYVDSYKIADYKASDNLLKAVPKFKNEIEHEIPENYGICFSSGTSENLKTINLRFLDVPQVKKSLKNNLRNIVVYFNYKRSFWSNKDNKVLIFMPFSHLQQRSFVTRALLLNVNIALSDPINCIKHIVSEKPNIMISVPVIYEVLAQRIQTKLERLPAFKKFYFKCFNSLKLNALSNTNLIKRMFSYYLFRDIAKVYGGKADYFVTGSAAIAPDVIAAFYSVGVKIYEAYGQSETGTISVNTPKYFKIGSVGKPCKEIRISEDSEIMVKYDENFNRHNKSILHINDEGYIHTGDLGYIDKQGYLFLKGRKDDVIVLTNGKKFFPSEIEKMFNTELINYACAFSKNNDSISLIVSSIDIKVLEPKMPGIIDEVNKKLPNYLRITDFMIAPLPFSVEDGLLTSTFKMRRQSIINKYSGGKFVSLIFPAVN